MSGARGRWVVGGVVLALAGCVSSDTETSEDADEQASELKCKRKGHNANCSTTSSATSTSSTTGAGGAGSGSSSSSSSSSTGSGGSGGAPANAYFPAASWFYQDISNAPVASSSATVTQWLQSNGGWGTGVMRVDFSIEVLQANASTLYKTFQTTGDFFSPDCDHVPVPVPVGGALEGENGYECAGDGDCHLIVKSDADGRLYEMWRANIVGNTFQGGCLAAWDMTRVYGPEGRGEQCSSADAAGFPIAPLLFTADEIAAGEINHAIRFILPNARMRAGKYVHPANHAGSPSGPTSAPVYGSRWRLRADYPINSLPSEGAKVVARAMQKYGMALADGGNIALTAQSDRFTSAKWAGQMGTYDLDDLQPTDFEVLDTGTPITLTYDCNRSAY